MNKILFVASEAFPLIKTGGLGDVAGSLCSALVDLQQDVRLVLPAYTEILGKIKQKKVIASARYYNFDVNIIESRLPDSQVVTWLIDCPSAFMRPGGPYMDMHGESWHDNALRFAIFCQAAVDLALNSFELNWSPDIIHCNDWQTGLIPALLSLFPQRPATIFTIHNIAYQGVFDHQTFMDLALPESLWHMEGVEFHGQFSFMKGGIAYADEITTVSQTYASEILSENFGYGLDGLLRHRKSRLTGIINGIDTKEWNPWTDKYISHNYNQQSLSTKSLNKVTLQEQLSLGIDTSIPLIGMVSRLVEQKGLEIILQSIEQILSTPVQLAVLGTGELHYELKLVEIARRYSGSMSVTIGYDEKMAHRIESGSDLFLMPSTFEPCGLNQMYSLRYGTLPIVTKVGGLADTVIHATEQNISNGTANGFVLSDISSNALITSIQGAVKLFRKNEVWQKLQINAMRNDYSWNNSARQYLSLYQKALLKD